MPDNNTIRIGTTGSTAGKQNKSFFSGTYNVSPPGGGVQFMIMDQLGQMGTTTGSIPVPSVAFSGGDFVSTFFYEAPGSANQLINTYDFGSFTRLGNLVFISIDTQNSIINNASGNPKWIFTESPASLGGPTNFAPSNWRTNLPWDNTTQSVGLINPYNNFQNTPNPGGGITITQGWGEAGVDSFARTCFFIVGGKSGQAETIYNATPGSSTNIISQAGAFYQGFYVTTAP